VFLELLSLKYGDYLRSKRRYPFTPGYSAMRNAFLPFKWTWRLLQAVLGPFPLEYGDSTFETSVSIYPRTQSCVNLKSGKHNLFSKLYFSGFSSGDVMCSLSVMYVCMS
jgi:hypothetical protein